MPKRLNLQLLTSVAFVAVLVLGMGACSSSGGGSANTAEPSTSATDADAAGATCGVHKVGSVQVRTFCGKGNANIKSTKSTFSLAKASCETSTDYLSVNAGTVVLGFDDAAKKLKQTTQYIGLTVGKVPGDTGSTAATKDGTFTGGILAINDKGTPLLPNPKTLKITLRNNRTAGAFTGSLVGGGTVSGSFICS